MLETKLPKNAYKKARGEEKLFFCYSDKSLAIRIIENSKEKDKIIFATSLAHKFSGEVKKNLMLSVPQIIDVEVLDSHELRIYKSPAVYLKDIQEEILIFLFTYLKEGKK